MTIRLKLDAPALRSAVVLSSIIAVVPAVAQSLERSGASAQPTVLGPAMPRSGAADPSCGAGPAGLASWSADVIEQALSLDGTQRVTFNSLKAASQRTIQYLNESCPNNDAASPTGHMETQERRFSAIAVSGANRPAGA